ncbi:acetyl-CoA carboxylase biotin carboxyl carrier protein [Clostridium sp. WILCCON 0269]|uniref:Biotin carboxyl carrier protein of acetyl-CoA carboxylase n=1 Tax=Candidatus Clostridium eludens TaxID=3381663 RepID=A0ABW8SIT7_9CLOT
MDFKSIENIIKIMDNSKLGYLEVNWQGVSIIMKKQGEEGNVKNINILGESKEKLNIISEKHEDKIVKTNEDNVDELEIIKSEVDCEGKKNDSIKEILSPIVGTFYSSPNPDKPAFISVGSKVKKGDVLCIIEAMKLMNEIQSEVDGEITEILVENEQMVEYGEPIFKIKTN